MYAECFDKVLYHVNSRILKCKMTNVITRVINIAFSDSTMLEKATTYNTSISKGYSSTTHKFMEIGTTTSRGARLSSLK
jgi:hypothetical protein